MENEKECCCFCLKKTRENNGSWQTCPHCSPDKLFHVICLSRHSIWLHNCYEYDMVIHPNLLTPVIGGVSCTLGADCDHLQKVSKCLLGGRRRQDLHICRLCLRLSYREGCDCSPDGGRPDEQPKLTNQLNPRHFLRYINLCPAHDDAKFRYTKRDGAKMCGLCFTATTCMFGPGGGGGGGENKKKTIPIQTCRACSEFLDKISSKEVPIRPQEYWTMTQMHDQPVPAHIGTRIHVHLPVASTFTTVLQLALFKNALRLYIYDMGCYDPPFGAKEEEKKITSTLSDTIMWLLDNPFTPDLCKIKIKEMIENKTEDKFLSEIMLKLSHGGGGLEISLSFFPPGIDELILLYLSHRHSFVKIVHSAGFVISSAVSPPPQPSYQSSIPI